MSDDEGHDDGDFEDIGEGALDGSEAGEPAATDADDGEAEEEEDVEEVLNVEEAAGSDDEDDDEEIAPADEDDDEADPIGVVSASTKAHPQKAKVDPILKLSNKHRIVRIVPPDERITDNRLHKSEAAYIIAMRSEQIAKFATSFTDSAMLHDPVAIAFRELTERRCPFVLRRAVGTGPAGELLVEEWNVREMAIPQLTPPVPLGGTVRAARRSKE